MSTTTRSPLVPPIVLLGPPGAGKSTVAPLLSQRLGFACVDLDDEIGVHHLHEGVASFRVREYLALQQALARGAVVVAAGAGVVDTEPARALLRQALCLRLQAAPSLCLARIDDDTRSWLPSRDDDRRAVIYAEREHGRDAHRSTLAHAVIDADAPPALVAAALAQAVWTWTPGCDAHDDVDDSDHMPALPRGFVIADEAVAARVRADVVLPGGEACKQWSVVESLLRAFVGQGVSRHDHIVAVGGGALLDVVGLAAALHHRGTPWSAHPTTLLAMVDASFGGKTAVDLDGLKNLAGAFWEPVPARVWTGHLRSLPDDAWRHGAAECVKMALLCGDVDDAEAIARAPRSVDAHAIRRARGRKRHVVSRDLRERHLRAVLNFGHTLAHALEAVTPIAHGDAVAHGLSFALLLAGRHAGLPDDDVRRARAAVTQLHAPPLPPLRAEAIALAMRTDKKNAGGALRFVLPTAGGAPALMTLPDDDVVDAIGAFLRGA